MARKVVIVGGGISGLAAAHRALELAPDAILTLIEASDRVGGVIRTLHQSDFLIETGPDNFITTKPAGLKLVERLALTGELIETNAKHRRAMVVRRGKLMPIPDGFLMMAPTKAMPILATRILSPLGKLRLAMEPLRPVPDGLTEDHDESLESFVTRRLGRQTYERLVQPLVGGVYTADPTTLSLRATLPRFLDMEREHGSLIRAMRHQRKAARSSDAGARYSMFVSFRRGMSTLTDALLDRIGEPRIRLGRRAESMFREGEGWSVRLDNGETIEADAVVVALPAHGAARLVRGFDPELADRLGAIEYASSAVVHLAWRRDQVDHPLDAFGFVVPAIENRRIMAGSFSSVKYAGRAPRHHVLMRAFLGGATNEAAMRKSDEALIAAARAEFRELLGVAAPPMLERIDRWERAMPQYKVGHVQRIAAIEELTARHPGLALAGNAYRGVGIPDCIADAEAAVERVLSA